MCNGVTAHYKRKYVGGDTMYNSIFRLIIQYRMKNVLQDNTSPEWMKDEAKNILARIKP